MHAFFELRGEVVNFGTPAVSDAYLSGGSAFLALIAEALGAFLLMWAVMGTAVNPAAPKGVAGIAIGGALGVGVLIFGPATGASFNPARWFGPALIVRRLHRRVALHPRPDPRRGRRRAALPRGDGARRAAAAAPDAGARGVRRAAARDRELKGAAVNVLAVSDFLRNIFLILVATPFILLWGCALWDLIKGHHSGWAIVGWMLLILVVPIIGPMIYFAVRKPTTQDVDEQYLAERALQQERRAGRWAGPASAPTDACRTRTARRAGTRGSRRRAARLGRGGRAGSTSPARSSRPGARRACSSDPVGDCGCIGRREYPQPACQPPARSVVRR